MPDDYGKENPIEYSFDDKGEYKIAFNIEVNSFIPAIDFDTERFSGNRMFTIQHGVNDGEESTTIGIDN